MMNTIGKRYAQAFYEIAEDKKQVIELYNELKSVSEIYVKNDEFREAMKHPSLKVETKKSLIKKLFKDMSETCLLVLCYLLEKERFDYIKDIAENYLVIYNERNAIVNVEATFAIKPTKEQKERLDKKLQKMTGKKVNMSIKIDRNIIGGGLLKIDDKIIDGSLRRQFEMLRANF